jgi:hypothetical protein
MLRHNKPVDASARHGIASRPFSIHSHAAGAAGGEHDRSGCCGVPGDIASDAPALEVGQNRAGLLAPRPTVDPLRYGRPGSLARKLPLPVTPARPIYTCRSCKRTSDQVFFRPMCRRFCAQCKDTFKRERAARVAAGAKPRGRRQKSVKSKVDWIGDPGPSGVPGHTSFLQHLAWVRSLPCSVLRPTCGTVIHAHHVRAGTGGGTGIKPGDEWAVPLCAGHHSEGHTGGWRTFEAKYRVDLRRVAMELAVASPFLPGSAKNGCADPIE